MSKYINLDDPDVTYSHNAGNHEVYIVGSEAERIDIVRCRECIWRMKDESCARLLGRVGLDDYCSKGNRGTKGAGDE